MKRQFQSQEQLLDSNNNPDAKYLFDDIQTDIMHLEELNKEVIASQATAIRPDIYEVANILMNDQNNNNNSKQALNASNPFKQQQQNQIQSQIYKSQNLTFKEAHSTGEFISNLELPQKVESQIEDRVFNFKRPDENFRAFQNLNPLNQQNNNEMQFDPQNFLNNLNWSKQQPTQNQNQANLFDQLIQKMIFSQQLTIEETMFTEKLKILSTIQQTQTQIKNLRDLKKVSLQMGQQMGASQNTSQQYCDIDIMQNMLQKIQMQHNSLLLEFPGQPPILNDSSLNQNTLPNPHQRLDGSQFPAQRIQLEKLLKNQSQNPELQISQQVQQFPQAPQVQQQQTVQEVEPNLEDLGRLKVKQVTGCPHVDKKHYSQGLCQSCYLAIYYKKRKAKAQSKEDQNNNSGPIITSRTRHDSGNPEVIAEDSQLQSNRKKQRVGNKREPSN